MAKMQVFTYDNLVLYDELLKGYVDAGDAKSLKTVAIDGNTLKFYRVSEPVGDTVPAYTITLPETDLSGLIPKITGAVAGNVVQAKADGTIEDSGVKVADLATKAEVTAETDRAKAAEKANSDAIAAINDENTGILKTAKDYADLKVSELADGQVKTNKEAIEAINHETTGILAQAKSYADGKDAAIQAAKDAADAAQADVDALEAKVGTVPEDKTVVQMIQEAQSAATYDDTEVRGLIQNNADAIEAHKTAIDNKVTTLVGSDSDKSVRTIANEELAAQLLSGKADADFKTLQELAAWLEGHPEEVAAINLDITNIKNLIGTIPEGATSTTVIAYIKELVDAEKTRATGVESGLDTRLGAVEALVGEGGSVDEKIATAKQEAIDAAAADATTKANTAETNAKAAVTALENGAVKTNADNIATLQGLVGEGVEAIPESSIRALFA